MRGSPLRQLILTFAGVGLAGALLYLLTAPPARQASNAHNPAPATSSPDLSLVYLTVRYAHCPESIVIRHGASILVEAKNPNLPSMEKEVGIAIPSSGMLRLKVDAVWPQGTPDTPITLTLEPDSRESRSETRWSSGRTIHDIFSFRWPS